MVINLFQFITDFLNYKNARNNPNQLTAQQIGGMEKEEFDALLKDYANNNAFPIDRVGDLSLFPVAIEGTYDAATRRNAHNTCGICLESDGSITYIAPFTNGVNLGLYRFSLPIDRLGKITQVKPKTGRYRNPLFDKYGFVPSTLTTTNANMLLVVQDDIISSEKITSQGIRRTGIVLTNGTLDERVHEASFLPDGFYSSNCGYYIFKGVGYIFPLSPGNCYIGIYTFDPKRIGKDLVLTLTKLPDTIKTTGFNKIAEETGRIRYASRWSTNGNQVTDDAVIHTPVNHGGSNVIGTGFPLITEHPTENKLRIFVMLRQYYDKPGWGSYNFPNFTIDLNLDTKEAVVDPWILEAGFNQVDPLMGSTAAMKFSGNLFKQVFMFTNQHQSPGVFFHPNNFFIRIQASNEGQWNYAVSQLDSVDKKNITAWELHDKRQWCELTALPNSISYSREITRYNATHLNDNFQGLVQVAPEYFICFSVYTNNSTLTGASGRVLFHIDDLDASYVYNDGSNGMHKMVGPRPYTYRRDTEFRDMEAFSSTTWNKKGEFKLNAWSFFDRCGYAFLNRQCNIVFNPNYTAYADQYTYDKGLRQLKEPMLDAFINKLIADKVIESNVPGGANFTTRSQLVMFDDPDLPCFLTIVMRAINGSLGIRMYTLKCNYTLVKEGDNEVISDLSLTKNYMVNNVSDPTAWGWGNSLTPQKSGPTSSQYAIWIKEDGYWVIQLYIDLENGTYSRKRSLIFTLRDKDDAINHKRSIANSGWMGGQNYLLYHPKMGLFSNAGDHSRNYGNAIGIYYRRDTNYDTFFKWKDESERKLYVFQMQQTLQGWNLFIPERMDFTFSGRTYSHEPTEFLLDELFPTNHKNNVFDIYVQRINDAVQIKMAIKGTVKENDDIIIFGECETDHERIIRTSSEKVTRLGGKRFSTVRSPNSIPVTTNHFLTEGNLAGWRKG